MEQRLQSYLSTLKTLPRRLREDGVLANFFYRGLEIRSRKAIGMRDEFAK